MADSDIWVDSLRARIEHVRRALAQADAEIARWQGERDRLSLWLSKVEDLFTAFPDGVPPGLESGVPGATTVEPDGTLGTTAHQDLTVGDLSTPPVDEITEHSFPQDGNHPVPPIDGSSPAPLNLAVFKGMGQMQVLRHLASLRGGIVEIAEAKDIISRLRIAKTSDRYLNSQLHHMMRDTKGWEKVGPSTYRWHGVPAEPTAPLFNGEGKMGP